MGWASVLTLMAIRFRLDVILQLLTHRQRLGVQHPLMERTHLYWEEIQLSGHMTVKLKPTAQKGIMELLLVTGLLLQEHMG